MLMLIITNRADIIVWVGGARLKESLHKGARKILLRFFLFGGGVPPNFAKFFLAELFSVKGGR